MRRFRRIVLVLVLIEVLALLVGLSISRRAQEPLVILGRAAERPQDDGVRAFVSRSFAASVREPAALRPPPRGDA